MFLIKKYISVLFAVFVLNNISYSFCGQLNNDPLPSWNEGSTKNSIIDFVNKSIDSSSESFIPLAERITVFDNDGTLICEQPVYFQMLYARNRIKELSHNHPEWNSLQPFKAILEDNLEFIQSAGTENYTTIMIAAREGLNPDQQTKCIQTWLDTAVHPRFNKKYIDLVYQPMLELLKYLRSNGFKTFIVSGGDTGFMRVFSEKVYGIPPEQVIGSFGRVKYGMTDDKHSIIPLDEIEHINNKDGKAVGIYNFIGRIPVGAFGNSDGDYEMLEYSTYGFKNHLGLLVHHNDSLREVFYDRNSAIGKLNKGLDDAEKNGWTIVDMEKDWKVVFK